MSITVTYKVIANASMYKMALSYAVTIDLQLPFPSFAVQNSATVCPCESLEFRSQKEAVLMCLESKIAINQEYHAAAHAAMGKEMPYGGAWALDCSVVYYHFLPRETR